MPTAVEQFNPDHYNGIDKPIDQTLDVDEYGMAAAPS